MAQNIFVMIKIILSWQVWATVAQRVFVFHSYTQYVEPLYFPHLMPHIQG